MTKSCFQMVFYTLLLPPSIARKPSGLRGVAMRRALGPPLLLGPRELRPPLLAVRRAVPLAPAGPERRSFCYWRNICRGILLKCQTVRPCVETQSQAQGNVRSQQQSSQSTEIQKLKSSRALPALCPRSRKPSLCATTPRRIVDRTVCQKKSTP